jgi:hypothetical protein
VDIQHGRAHTNHVDELTTVPKAKFYVSVTSFFLVNSDKKKDKYIYLPLPSFVDFYTESAW